MTTLSVTQAAFAGFGLLRRKPLTVMAWGAFFGVVVGVMAVVMIAIVGASAFGGFAAAIQNAGANPEAMDPTAIAGAITGIMGSMLLFALVVFLVIIVLYGAVFRAILEPENSGFAYIRLGMQELMLLVVMIVQVICVYAVELAIILVVSIISGVAIAVNRDVGVIVAVVTAIAGGLVLFWLCLRFSMAGVISFAERRFALMDSWSMTKGHSLQLFVIGLLVIVAVIGVYLVFALIMILVGGGAGAAIGGMTGSGPPTPAALAVIIPVGLICFAAVVVFYGFIMALMLAPWADVYRQLKGPVAVEQTFT